MGGSDKHTSLLSISYHLKRFIVNVPGKLFLKILYSLETIFHEFSRFFTFFFELFVHQSTFDGQGGGFYQLFYKSTNFFLQDYQLFYNSTNFFTPPPTFFYNSTNFFYNSTNFFFTILPTFFTILGIFLNNCYIFTSLAVIS